MLGVVVRTGSVAVKNHFSSAGVFTIFSDIDLWKEDVLCVFFFIRVNSKVSGKRLIITIVIIKGIHFSFMSFYFYRANANDAFDLTSLAYRSNFSRNPILASFFGIWLFKMSALFFCLLVYLLGWTACNGCPRWPEILCPGLLHLCWIVIWSEKVGFKDLFSVTWLEALLDDSLIYFFSGQCVFYNPQNLVFHIRCILDVIAAKVDLYFLVVAWRGPQRIANDKCDTFNLSSIASHVKRASQEFGSVLTATNGRLK